jgi:septal ring factor EnvC (AmiA/AmiB activator)
MNKTVVVIMAIALVVSGYFLWRQANNLAQVRTELEAVQSDLTEARAKYDTLQADYDALKADREAVSKKLAATREELPPLEGPIHEERSKSTVKEYVLLEFLHLLRQVL